MGDMVNKPPHYTKSGIQPIDVMIAWRIGYYTCLGNAIKYIARYPHKGTPEQDLRKAEWYVKKAREIVTGKAPRDYYSVSEVVAEWGLPPDMARALQFIEGCIDNNPERHKELEKACKSLEKQIDKLNDIHYNNK